MHEARSNYASAIITMSPLCHLGWLGCQHERAAGTGAGPRSGPTGGAAASALARPGALAQLTAGTPRHSLDNVIVRPPQSPSPPCPSSGAPPRRRLVLLHSVLGPAPPPPTPPLPSAAAGGGELQAWQLFGRLWRRSRPRGLSGRRSASPARLRAAAATQRQPGHGKGHKHHAGRTKTIDNPVDDQQQQHGGFIVKHERSRLYTRSSLGSFKESTMSGLYTISY